MEGSLAYRAGRLADERLYSWRVEEGVVSKDDGPASEP